MQTKPKLQLALDNLKTTEALEDVKMVNDHLDVIEVGTILCLADGMEAVKKLRDSFPEKDIVADTKCADAGKTIAKMCSDAGANIMTVICAAEISTMESALEEIDELQVELYGNWTFEQAAEWQQVGVEQVVYHQSRDALSSGKSWSKKDLEKIEKLIEMGFKVSVTGGLVANKVEFFKGLNVYAFISGRGIRNAENPKAAAREFQKEISKFW
jgi:3-dehydro-L-gulonate-6-phosphate decarboxylase